jgi:acyl dehydratase
MRTDDLLTEVGPFPFVLATDDLARYLAAINHPSATSAHSYPLLYSTRWLWDAMSEAVGRIVCFGMGQLALHRSHAVELYRRPAMGVSLISSARVTELLPLRDDLLVTVEILTDGDDGLGPVSSCSTSVLVRDASQRLPRLPNDEAPTFRDRRVSPSRIDETVVVEERIDSDQPVRYAAASDDWNPIHIDHAAALAAGFDGPVLQGMCAFAFASRAVSAVADRDRADLYAAGVRFARPVRPGEVLRTTVRLGHTVDEQRAAWFQSETGSGVVLKGGWCLIGDHR